MAPEHRLADAGRLRLADVLGEAFVGLAHGGALQDDIDAQALAAARALALRIRMTTFTGLCEMVAHGVGAAPAMPVLAGLGQPGRAAAQPAVPSRRTYTGLTPDQSSSGAKIACRSSCVNAIFCDSPSDRIDCASSDFFCCSSWIFSSSVPFAISL